MHTILIDGNNWGFAGMANPKLSAGDRDTQSIFSVLHKLQNVVSEYPNANIIVLWDGRSWRNDIYSEYKANRGKTEKEQEARKAYFDQKQDIMKGIELLGVRQMWGTNMEADDLAQILSEKLGTVGAVTLMTADKDWQQLVSHNVNWIDAIHYKSCNYSDFHKVTGYPTRELFLEAKCILGDAGDNIKGINGVGPKALEGVYACWRSFEHFLGAMSMSPELAQKRHLDIVGKRMPKALRELDLGAALDKLESNMELVDLATTARPKIETMVDKKGKLDVEAFTEFCHKNAFLSIVRRMEDFTEGFKRNKYVTR